MTLGFCLSSPKYLNNLDGWQNAFTFKESLLDLCNKQPNNFITNITIFIPNFGAVTLPHWAWVASRILKLCFWVTGLASLTTSKSKLCEGRKTYITAYSNITKLDSCCLIGAFTSNSRKGDLGPCCKTYIYIHIRSCLGKWRWTRQLLIRINKS